MPNRKSSGIHLLASRAKILSTMTTIDQPSKNRPSTPSSTNTSKPSLTTPKTAPRWSNTKIVLRTPTCCDPNTTRDHRSSPTIGVERDRPTGMSQHQTSPSSVKKRLLQPPRLHNKQIHLPQLSPKNKTKISPTMTPSSIRITRLAKRLLKFHRKKLPVKSLGSPNRTE